MRIAFGLAALAFCCSLPVCAPADTTGTLTGKVAYVKKSRLGVQANRQSNDFIMDDDFTNIRNSDGKRVGREKLTVGTLVTVTFLRSSLFGSSRVTEVDIIGGGGVMGTPLPIPTQPAH
jgi:hypothetical protein